MIFFLLISLFTLLTPRSVLAGNNLTVICQPGPGENEGFCQTTPQNLPLFQEEDIKPGYKTYQTLTVENHSLTEDCQLSLSVSNHNDNILKNVLINLLTRNGSLVYTGYMATLFANPPVFIETIPANQTYLYDWQVSMDTAADNDYQGQHLEFDLSLNFQCLDQEPTPTPNPYRDLILNEIFPNPCDDANEWVEIYNSGGNSLDLSGWGITDSNTALDHFKYFAAGAAIPGGGYSYLNFNSVFNNASSDYARLFSNFSILWDTSPSYPNTTEGYSWSRQSDGTWCKTLPTLNAPNGPCLSAFPPVDCGGGPTPTSVPAPPTCDYPAPSAPQNLTAVTESTTTIRLNWSPPPSGTVTHYAILYGLSPGNYLYGDYNVGNVTSYLVSGLAPGTTYYFVVMAVNNCAPSPYSAEATAGTGGIPPVIPIGPAEGFESIHGATTETGEIGGGDEMGVSTEAGCCPKYSLWWWLLLFSATIYFVRLYQKTGKDRKNILKIHLLVPLTFMLAHFFLVRFVDSHFSFLPTHRWTNLFPLLIIFLSFSFYPFKKET